MRREPDDLSDVFDPATGEYTGIYGTTFDASHGIRDSGIPWYCKFVAMMLIDRARIIKWEPRGWEAYPSLPLLAADCGLSYTMAAKGMRELQRAGLLTAERDEAGDLNHYVLDCFAMAALPKRPPEKKYTPKVSAKAKAKKKAARG